MRLGVVFNRKGCMCSMLTVEIGSQYMLRRRCIGTKSTVEDGWGGTLTGTKSSETKRAAFVNDPNGWFEDPRDLVAAIKRIVHVSVESTRRLLRGLPGEIMDGSSRFKPYPEAIT